MRAVIAAALRRLAHRLEPAPTVVRVELDGEAIVHAIKLRNRRKGLGEAGI
jgi:hypothetical protein